MNFGKEIHPWFVTLYPIHPVIEADHALFPPNDELNRFVDWYRDETMLERTYNPPFQDFKPDLDCPF